MQKIFIAVLALAVLLCACQGSTNKTDFSQAELTDIIVKAQQDGNIFSLGMPDDWANWGDTWEELYIYYGLEHSDDDISSQNELDRMKDPGENAIGDIGDVGYEYGAQAEEAGITLKYKTSYWDDIPEWAKDDDGDWMVAYTGTMAFLVKDEMVDQGLTSWNDLLQGDYIVAAGDVLNGSLGQYAVYCAAVAMGGSRNNIQPGIDFYKQLAEENRLVEDIQSYEQFIESNAAVHVRWDFVALQYRDQAEEQGIALTACIPQDASVTVGYASIININAENPYAAALTREYIFSDAGQLNLAEGYATPIRNVKLPDDLAAKRIESSQYTDAMITNALEFDAELAATISQAWVEQVQPLLTEGAE